MKWLQNMKAKYKRDSYNIQTQIIAVIVLLLGVIGLVLRECR